jgi:lipoate-protein ligase B
MVAVSDAAPPAPPPAAPSWRFGFEAVDLGRLDYLAAWDVQRRYHAEVADGRRAPTLLLVEHDPVITFGRKGGRDHLRVGEEEL